MKCWPGQLITLNDLTVENRKVNLINCGMGPSEVRSALHGPGISPACPALGLLMVRDRGR